jgi:hypothetical protein
MHQNIHLHGLAGVRRPLAGAAAAFVLATTLLAAPGQARAQAPFAQPIQAAEALIDAMASNDEAALSRVLGKNFRQLTGIREVDVEDRFAFLQLASQSKTIKEKDGRAELVVGTDPWTVPIPIVRGRDGQWRFDPVAARDEILVLQIGANERAAMQAAMAYVDAQREYALADRNGDGLLEYAQKLLSSPGKRDGLIWSPSLGDESPLGEAFLPTRPGAGYHGYRFKILTAQGPAASGGARSYLIGKRMVRGFALVAWPVQYGKTGVMSFIVNQDGTVLERDLGANSARTAMAMKVFNPEEGWKPAKP